jgi:effector-binding domain-containing protein
MIWHVYRLSFSQTFLSGDETMTLECQLLDRSAQPALVIRKRAPFFRLGKIFGEAYKALEEYLAELGEKPADAPFAAYYNMNMFSLDIAIGFPVSRELPGRGVIQSAQIPGGKTAACLHIGPYRNVGPVYKALREWIRAKGYTATGVIYEFYLNDPGVTPPNELRTQVVMPLQ